jgi:plastocyanin
MMNSTHKAMFGGLLFAAVVPLAARVGCDAAGWRAATTAPPRSLSHGPAEIERPRPAQTTASVSIDNFSFGPAVVTVAPGTTVTWVNHDDAPHTVTANDKAFASETLDTDDRFSHRFDTPGTYPYFCAVHPHMTAEVVVK